MGDEVTDSRPTPENTCAVVVTYHPTTQIAGLLAVLATQIGHVIVVDNNSGAASRNALRDLCTAMQCILIENASNRGIAAAINQGVTRAAEQEGLNWALLFDQDSAPFDSILAGLAGVLAAYPEFDKVAIVGANFIDRATGMLGRNAEIPPVKEWLRCSYVITSGSLVSIPIWRQLGGMREEFFIDYVDYDYCFRADQSDYIVLLTAAPLMYHSVGRKTAHSILGKTVWTSNHSAERRYYIARNHFAMMKEQVSLRPRWVVGTFMGRCKSTIWMLLFECEKWAKLRATLLGMRDGLLSNFAASPLGGTQRSPNARDL